ncbi:DSHCT domain-containing protein [Diplocarpon rosae]|nr:DSHCT domain-containing protein [Diplocarpon rosae]
MSTISRPLPSEGPSAGVGDEFDDLFNYDANMDDPDDPFSENYVGTKDKQRLKETEAKSKGADGLGIDDAVEVTRKPRAPRVKLDENRLLSSNGIPKLRNRAKHHLKFKGKGHEYSDAEKLLSMYQIWLDDLFPKARFLDALGMVEKMGHKKRMQMMRMEWINEGKPQAVHEDSLFDEPTLPSTENDKREKTTSTVAPIFEAAAVGRPKTPIPNDSNGADTEIYEDLYGATPRPLIQRRVESIEPQESLIGEARTSIFGPAKTVEQDEPDDDELDVLMAEAKAEHSETVTQSNKSGTLPSKPNDGTEDDDLDALLAEEDMLKDAGKKSAPTTNKPEIVRDAFEDEMEAMADMEDMCKMAESLVSALEKVHLPVSETEDTAEDWIDHVLEEQRPLKRATQSPEDLKRELERKFFTPSASFSAEWLNKLQQRWEAPTDYTALFKIAPTQTRTITRFTREGLSGRVTGYKEVTVPANSATAKNSTSFLRKPANKADFVRGAAGFYPFAPGGLEGVEAAAALEEQFLKSANEDLVSSGTKGKLERVINLGDGGLLEIAPGLKRGLDFDKKKKTDGDEKEANDILGVLDEEPDVELPQEKENGIGSGDSDDVSEEDGEDDIDSLLPVEFPALEPHGVLAASSSKRGGREWAHMVDIKKDITNFRELVPDMAREWPFELDTFQKEAVYHLENGDSVFVAAHTSAGKTVVAEYAIALAAKHMTKAIYTSPIKALSNQKFRDFRQIFDEVGILTGDVQIAPEASCLIMTTEILRSMLYRGADLIRDVEFVIFDEVHYVNDLERGVVWEEVIIMLPEHVTLILLSATVPNTYEFASWVGRTKKKDIHVISTPKRPVPLEHYLWAEKGIHKIVDAEKKFLERGWKDANDVLSGKNKIKSLPPAESNPHGRGNIRGGRGQNQRGGNQRGGGQRGGAPQRGRGGPPRASHAPGHMGRGGRPGGRTSAAQDKTLWVHLVQFLKKESLLPACIFVFSKKRCEENADALSNQDFCSATEKSAIHMIIEKSIARLKPEDRVLPQIVRLRDMLGRGIAVHHGGMLPIVKEVVEMLFAQTLVKVLFATETFAMGLNLPTRTVVFSGYRKHDGHSFRNLLPGEYTQMAGRAGRRGLDPVGSVIIVAPGGGEAPPVTELRQMILGDPSKLRSQFRLTYNMILNLLRVEALKIEEMIKRSFSEHATQQLLPEHEKAVKVSEADLAKIKREPCDICDADLEACHQAAQNVRQLTLNLHLGLLATPVGRRMFSAKRLIVYNRDGIRTPGILLREGSTGGPAPTVHVLEIRTQRDQRDSTDLLPYLPKFRKLFTKLPQAKKHIQTKALQIPVADLECITSTIVKGVVPDIFASGDAYQLAKEQLARLYQNLQLLPDYEQRIQVLRDLEFVDDSTRVQLKGKVACEIHSADELVLTELILDNVLAPYEPAEIVALLSAFVFQEKTDTVPNLTGNLERGMKTIIEISEKVNERQTYHQVIFSADDSNDFVSRPRFGLMEVVYEWARGMSFKNITDLTDVLEGTIVRVITRLDETCREVKNAARIIGDPELFTKMQTCQEMIKRDITAVASLYM